MSSPASVPASVLPHSWLGCVTGHHSGQWRDHDPDAVPGVDCVLHHPPVPAAALHLGGAGHHPQIRLPDRLLHLISLCLLCHHSAVAGVS